jgi:hypothetical protein
MSTAKERLILYVQNEIDSTAQHLAFLEQQVRVHTQSLADLREVMAGLTEAKPEQVKDPEGLHQGYPPHHPVDGDLGTVPL